jgi:anti-sigma factor RsiW
MAEREEIDIEALLSAYADGELSGADKSRAEAHLAAHPEAKAQVDEYRRLGAIARPGGPAAANAPAVTSEEWRGVWSAVRMRSVGGAVTKVAALAARRSTMQMPRVRTMRMVRWWVGAATAAAAVIVAAIMVYQPGTPVTPAEKRKQTQTAGAVTHDEKKEFVVHGDKSDAILVLPKSDMNPDYLKRVEAGGDNRKPE